MPLPKIKHVRASVVQGGGKEPRDAFVSDRGVAVAPVVEDLEGGVGLVEAGWNDALEVERELR